jgi:hypothetical protein
MLPAADAGSGCSRCCVATPNNHNHNQPQLPARPPAAQILAAGACGRTLRTLQLTYQGSSVCSPMAVAALFRGGLTRLERLKLHSMYCSNLLRIDQQKLRSVLRGEVADGQLLLLLHAFADSNELLLAMVGGGAAVQRRGTGGTCARACGGRSWACHPGGAAGRSGVQAPAAAAAACMPGAAAQRGLWRLRAAGGRGSVGGGRRQGRSGPGSGGAGRGGGCRRGRRRRRRAAGGL